MRLQCLLSGDTRRGGHPPGGVQPPGRRAGRRVRGAAHRQRSTAVARRAPEPAALRSRSRSRCSRKAWPSPRLWPRACSIETGSFRITEEMVLQVEGGQGVNSIHAGCTAGEGSTHPHIQDTSARPGPLSRHPRGAHRRNEHNQTKLPKNWRDLSPGPRGRGSRERVRTGRDGKERPQRRIPREATRLQVDIHDCAAVNWQGSMDGKGIAMTVAARLSGEPWGAWPRSARRDFASTLNPRPQRF